jgi:hypothetical protein
MPYFTPEHLAEFQEKLGTIEHKYKRLLFAFTHHLHFQKETAWEGWALAGAMRCRHE